MEEYRAWTMFDMRMRNGITRDLLVYDGSVIHADASSHGTSMSTFGMIEKIANPKSWGYLDRYVALFRLAPRRPRSCAGAMLRWISCIWCFATDSTDIYTKMV